MKAIKITIPEYNDSGYILSKKNSKSLMYEIDAMLEDGYVGDKIQITVIEITEEKYKNLPEFTGW